jgi:hypothetical protein
VFLLNLSPGINTLQSIPGGKKIKSSAVNHLILGRKYYHIPLPHCIFSGMDFSGFQWQVKDYRTHTHGPGDNYFDPNNVWVDNGLHLKISNGRCASLKTKETLGYGTYRFYLDTRFDRFPRGVVLGLFTYKSDDKEIDIELRTREKDNGSFVVQEGGKKRFLARLNGSYTLHQFTWRPHKVLFESFHGHDTKHLIRSWPCRDHIPTSEDEKVHINLWLKEGFQAEAHAVIKKFEFIPL